MSTPGLTNNLKRTAAATAITRGITHLTHDELSSPAPELLPLEFMFNGRD